MPTPDVVPDGMMEIWTIERPTDDGGVFIDDFRLTAVAAYEEVMKRGWPWESVRLVVPYADT